MTTRLIFTGLITYSYVHGGYFISSHDNLHNMNNQPEINGKTQIHINVVAILLGLATVVLLQFSSMILVLRWCGTVHRFLWSCLGSTK